MFRISPNCRTGIEYHEASQWNQLVDTAVLKRLNFIDASSALSMFEVGGFVVGGQQGKALGK
jgi:hypothetical protein